MTTGRKVVRFQKKTVHTFSNICFYKMTFPGSWYFLVLAKLPDFLVRWSFYKHKIAGDGNTGP